MDRARGRRDIAQIVFNNCTPSHRPGQAVPDGPVIGWAPGRGPIVSPDGMPWHLNRGDDLVVELHMLAAKEPAVVSPSSHCSRRRRRRCGRR